MKKKLELIKFHWDMRGGCCAAIIFNISRFHCGEWLIYLYARACVQIIKKIFYLQCVGVWNWLKTFAVIMHAKHIKYVVCVFVLYINKLPWRNICARLMRRIQFRISITCVWVCECTWRMSAISRHHIKTKKKDLYAPHDGWIGNSLFQNCVQRAWMRCSERKERTPPPMENIIQLMSARAQDEFYS